MKKKAKLLTLPILACLGVFSVTTTTNAQQCPPRPTLKIDEHTLDFSEKRSVCVRKNGTFRIKLKPENSYPLDYDDVTVKQKKGWTPIRKKSVNGQGIMTVEVGNFPAGTDPAYKIKVKGVGVLDPRVRIIQSYLSLNPAYENIEDHLLEEYGLSFSGLLEIDQHLQEEYGTSLSEILVTIWKLDKEE